MTTVADLINAKLAEFIRLNGKGNVTSANLVMVDIIKLLTLTLPQTTVPSPVAPIELADVPLDLAPYEFSALWNDDTTIAGLVKALPETNNVAESFETQSIEPATAIKAKRVKKAPLKTIKAKAKKAAAPRTKKTP